MAQQALADGLGYPLPDQREAQRIAAPQALQYKFGPAAQFSGVVFYEFNRGDHLAVTRRLKKSHVLGVGIDHIHSLEIDLPAAQSLPYMPGHNQIARYRDGCAIEQE